MCTSTYSWKNHNPFALDAPANYLCTLIYSTCLGGNITTFFDPQV